MELGRARLVPPDLGAGGRRFPAALAAVLVRDIARGARLAVRGRQLLPSLPATGCVRPAGSVVYRQTIGGMRDQLDRDPLAVLEASIAEAKQIVLRSRALIEVSKAMVERASNTLSELTETARKQRELAIRVRKASRLSPWREGEN